MKAPISVKIRQDVDQELREVAARRGVTISSIIEHGIDRYLGELAKREGGDQRQGQKRKSAQATR